jgi:hypothetical protein
MCAADQEWSNCTSLRATALDHEAILGLDAACAADRTSIETAIAVGAVSRARQGAADRDRASDVIMAAHIIVDAAGRGSTAIVIADATDRARTARIDIGSDAAGQPRAIASSVTNVDVVSPARTAFGGAVRAKTMTNAAASACAVFRARTLVPALVAEADRSSAASLREAVQDRDRFHGAGRCHSHRFQHHGHWPRQRGSSSCARDAEIDTLTKSSLPPWASGSRTRRASVELSGVGRTTAQKATRRFRATGSVR